MEPFDLNLITEPLLSWFYKHARSLPWREDPTPYHVWVSEIMLQQTRVEAVKPYYARFLETLPTLSHLAACEEDVLLKLWEGLGYYNRVRNMQKAAQEVVASYDGELPADYEALRSLKGIGNYTAGAIASIAYGIAVPAVDGNVLRVMMRLTADDSDIMKQSVKSRVENQLLPIIPPDAAGAFNQALMELGATVCVPNGAPLCESCPCASLCEAKKKGIAEQLPVKKKAKERRIEKRTVLLLCDEKHIVLQKRPQQGLLAGLYEFPNELGHLSTKEALRLVQEMELHPLHIKKLSPAKHIFSHIEWHMIGYMIRVDSLTRQAAAPFFVDLDVMIKEYSIPSAFSAYLQILKEQLS